MKFKENFLFKEKGISIIEVLIAIGLLTVISSGFTTILINTLKTQHHFEKKQDFMNLYENFTKLVNDTEMCTSNFYGINLNLPPNNTTNSITDILGTASSPIQKIYYAYKYNPTTNEFDENQSWNPNKDELLIDVNFALDGIQVTNIKLTLYAGTLIANKWEGFFTIYAKKEDPSLSTGTATFKKSINVNIIQDVSGKISSCYGNILEDNSILEKLCEHMGGHFDENADPHCSFNQLNVNSFSTDEGISLSNNSNRVFTGNNTSINYNNNSFITGDSFSVGNFGIDGSSIAVFADQTNRFSVSSNGTLETSGDLGVNNNLNVGNCLSVGGSGCNGAPQICIGGNCRETFEEQKCEQHQFAKKINPDGTIVCTGDIKCDDNQYLIGIKEDGSPECITIPKEEATCGINEYIAEIKEDGTPICASISLLKAISNSGCNQGEYLQGFKYNSNSNTVETLCHKDKNNFSLPRHDLLITKYIQKTIPGGQKFFIPDGIPITQNVGEFDVIHLSRYEQVSGFLGSGSAGCGFGEFMYGIHVYLSDNHTGDPYNRIWEAWIHCATPRLSPASGFSPYTWQQL